MSKPIGQSASTVQESIKDGSIVHFTGQDKVKYSIWDRIHKKRFHISYQAPIYQGQLRGDFGYLAKTPATSQVLSGTYNYPPVCDTATKYLLQ